MQPSSSRAGMTTVSLFERRQRGIGLLASSVMALDLAEISSQSGCSVAWFRISSSMSSVVRDGAQFQCRGRARHRAPSRGRRTGVPSRTGSTGWSPRRSRHQFAELGQRARRRETAADVHDARDGRDRSPRSAARSAARGPPGAGSRAPGGRVRRSRCSAAGASRSQLLIQ